MKKSRLKLAVKKALDKHYIKQGYTNTAASLYKDLIKEINRA